MSLLLFPFLKCFSCQHSNTLNNNSKYSKEYKKFKDFQDSRIVMYITPELLVQNKNGIGIMLQPRISSSPEKIISTQIQVQVQVRRPSTSTTTSSNSASSQDLMSSSIISATSAAPSSENNSASFSSISTVCSSPTASGSLLKSADTAGITRRSSITRIENSYPTVDYIYPQSIAEMYGIQPGAKLTKIDYDSTKYMSYEEVVTKLKQSRKLEFWQTKISSIGLNTNQYEITSFPSPSHRYFSGMTSNFHNKEILKEKKLKAKHEQKKSVHKNKLKDNVLWNDHARKRFWISDNVAKKCHSCGDPFQLMRRRHHCRSCGHIFCRKCCIRLPQSFCLSNHSNDNEKEGSTDYESNSETTQKEGCSCKQHRKLQNQMSNNGNINQSNKISVDFHNLDYLRRRLVCYGCLEQIENGVALACSNRVSTATKSTESTDRNIIGMSAYDHVLSENKRNSIIYVLAYDNISTESIMLSEVNEESEIDISVRSLVLSDDYGTLEVPSQESGEDSDVDDYIVNDSAERRRLKNLYQIFSRVHTVIGNLQMSPKFELHSTKYANEIEKTVKISSTIRKSASEPYSLVVLCKAAEKEELEFSDNETDGKIFSCSSFDDFSFSNFGDDHLSSISKREAVRSSKCSRKAKLSKHKSLVHDTKFQRKDDEERFMRSPRYLDFIKLNDLKILSSIPIDIRYSQTSVMSPTEQTFYPCGPEDATIVYCESDCSNKGSEQLFITTYENDDSFAGQQTASSVSVQLDCSNPNISYAGAFSAPSTIAETNHKKTEMMLQPNSEPLNVTNRLTNSPTNDTMDSPIDVQSVDVKRRIMELMQEHEKAKIKENIYALFQLSSVLSQLPVGEMKTWIDLLNQYANKVMEDVVCTPNKRGFMDPTSYVQIEAFPGGNIEESFYVDGVIYNKSLARKNMRKFIQHPRILLIASSLDYVSNHRRSLLLTLESACAEMNEYMQIIASKLLMLSPDIIVCGGHIHRIAEEILAKRNVSIIKNASLEVMKSISRKTGALLLSSADHVDKYSASNIIGICSIFKVVSSVDDTSMRSSQIPRSEEWQRENDLYDFTGKIQSNSSNRPRHIIIFEGGVPHKGGTVCLRGNAKNVLSELRSVLFKAINSAYNMRLESSYYSDVLLNPPALLPNYTDRDIEFLDGSTSAAALAYSPYFFVNPESVGPSGSLNDATPIIKEQGNDSLAELNYDDTSVSRGYRNSDSAIPALVGSNIDMSRNEKIIQHKDIETNHEFLLLSICWSRLSGNFHSSAQLSCIKYYDPLLDCTLGQFLTQYCFAPSNKEFKYAFKENKLTFSHGYGHICLTVNKIEDCPYASLSLLRRSSRMEQGKERVNRDIFLNQLHPAVKLPLLQFGNKDIQNYDESIYVWLASTNGFTRPKVANPMSSDTWNLSFGRFLESFFYRLNMIPDNEVSNHLTHTKGSNDTSIVRCFSYKGLVATFSFKRISPILRVIRQPHLWNNEMTERDIPYGELETIDKLSKKVYNTSIFKVQILLNSISLADNDSDTRKLRRMKADIVNWEYRLRSAIRCHPLRSNFELNAMIRDMYVTCATWSRALFAIAEKCLKEANHKMNQPIETKGDGFILLRKRNHDHVLTTDGTENSSSENNLSESISVGDALCERVTVPLVTFNTNSNQDNKNSDEEKEIRPSTIEEVNARELYLEIPAQLLEYHPGLQYNQNKPIVLINNSQLTSIIAYSLFSDDYLKRLTSYTDETCQEEENHMEDNTDSVDSVRSVGSDTNMQLDRNTLLYMMRSTFKSHIDHRFSDENVFSSKITKFRCKSYYAMQFHALRMLYYGQNDRFVESLGSCSQWNSGGGKSGSGFMKTKDERFIAKMLPKTEVLMLLSIIEEYFNYMGKIFQDGLVSILSKILGLYKLNIQIGVAPESQYYVMIMENNFYRGDVDFCFDLKGKLEGRFKRASEWDSKHGTVLWDRNFVKMNDGIPLSIDESAMTILSSAIYADTKFLASIHATDYSLLVGYNKSRQEISCCIIDYIHKYDFKKMMEHASKRLIQEQDEITVLNPKQYRKRFRLAMLKYFTIVPTKSTKCVAIEQESAMKFNSDGLKPTSSKPTN